MKHINLEKVLLAFIFISFTCLIFTLTAFFAADNWNDLATKLTLFTSISGVLFIIFYYLYKHYD